MGFKKGNQNIDSVFYGTDYVERMYLGGGEPFFQASYLDFYKTNFFSIGLGQEKRQIDNPMGDGAISYIKTEWSSQYGYQLEVNVPKEKEQLYLSAAEFVNKKIDTYMDTYVRIPLPQKSTQEILLMAILDIAISSIERKQSNENRSFLGKIKDILK